MVFNSFTFLIFFAVLIALNRMPISWRSRKMILLLASYLFYAAWNPPFVLLLWVSTVADWFLAGAIHRSSRESRRKLYLVCSLVVNLGLLGFFKYGGFLLDNLVTITQSMGISWQPAEFNIILPVGISFYTFQTLSYSIDVYRRKLEPSDSFLNYALYVTFFPQLVAGPIVRASDFLPQCDAPQSATARQLSWGMSLTVVGLFNKMVIADHLMAPVVERVFDGSAEPGFVDAWLGTMAFSAQIFCDFAGYSTCAIGAALCLGFSLPDNFRFPYAAIGFSDFWRRWHISLSTWLRDYLYIPLGGNRQGSFKTWRNLIITMLLGGLWHGASWTFVVWGAIHGSYLAVERFVVMLFKPFTFWSHQWSKAFLALFTYCMICFSWVFFRADSFHRAASMCASMVGHFPEDQPAMLSTFQRSMVAVLIPVMLLIHWGLRDSSLEQLAERIPRPVLAVILGIMLYLLSIVPGESRAFIYFQF